MEKMHIQTLTGEDAYTDIDNQKNLVYGIDENVCDTGVIKAYFH
jgi:hypothetical protein